MTQELAKTQLTIRSYHDYDYSIDPDGVLREDAGRPLVVDAYWSDLRIDRENVPNNYKAYGVRGEDIDGSFVTSIARMVTVNHIADVLVDVQYSDELDAMLDNDGGESILESYAFTDDYGMPVSNRTFLKSYRLAED